MIAQALACDPKLLIADEPTTALDVTVQAEILKLMRDLRTRIDSGIVLITHDMGVVADMADPIIVMKDGRVVERATADEIFAPRSTRTRSSCSTPCRTSGRSAEALAGASIRGRARRPSRRARRSRRRHRAVVARAEHWSSSTRAAVARPRSGRSTAST